MPGGPRAAGPVAAGPIPAGAVAAGAIASVATDGVTLHGAMSVSGGRASLGSDGDITAGTKAAAVELARGGTLLVCATTTLHLAKDRVRAGAPKPGDAGLMLSLDRGAFETDYRPGAYSDVILTPDLRLLLSAPGLARVKLRVNAQGDTCVDNAGAQAPYLVVSSVMDGGVYRVQPGQRVLFVHGSLQQVVDNEKEPCGCPPAEPAMETAANGGHVGGPSSTAADTAFPTAVSEGLAPAETIGSGPGPVTPVVPNGVAHAQVQATLSSDTPPGLPPGLPLGPPPGVATDGAAPGTAGETAAGSGPAAVKSNGKRGPGLFGKIGRFFARVFGAER
jgi:hypothetical protein